MQCGLLETDPLLQMLLFDHHLHLIPSVLDVDINPPVGVRFGERLGSPERLGTFGEYDGTTVLMFDGPLVAGVLISEDVVAIGFFHISSPASPSGILPWLGSAYGDAPGGDRRSRYRDCICPLGADSSARARQSLRGGFRLPHWCVSQCASLLVCEEVVEVHRCSIREDEQAHDIRAQLGVEALSDTLAGSMGVGTKSPR